MQGIVIREAKAIDAEALIALKKSYIRGTTTIPLYEDEYTNTIADESALIARFQASPNSVLLVAEHDGRLIGNLDITGSPRRKLAHTAMLGMGVATHWQNKKVGSLLMEAAVKWALNGTPLKLIWLELYSINYAGRRLYEKFGFSECGTVKDFFQEEVVCDKISMVKYL
ncbi:GNAT family N-acetyltransferase [Flavobacterium sp. RHBU_24]|uniref:GNAT family N-acetyltransferase n=1 Tax=Flavobacterium sp. RHBU_24 TaxID=3391185 RepID=UPI003984FBA5